MIKPLIIIIALLLGGAMMGISIDLEEWAENCPNNTIPYLYEGEVLCGSIPQPEIYNNTILIVNGTINDSFVYKTGDTMTGNLNVTTNVTINNRLFMGTNEDEGIINLGGNNNMIKMVSTSPSIKWDAGGAGSTWILQQVGADDRLRIFGSGNGAGEAITIWTNGSINILNDLEIDDNLKIRGNTLTEKLIVTRSTNDYGYLFNTYTTGHIDIGYTTDSSTFYGNHPALTMNLSGDTVINNNLDVKNNITGNLHYAEMWGQHIGEVTLTAISTYANVTNYTSTRTNGFNYSTGILTSEINGLLLVNSHMAFSGTANQEYHLQFAVNNIAATNCHTERVIGNGGDVGSASITCLCPVTTGDEITLQIENVDSSNNPNVHDINVNIVRIGD